MTHVRRHLALPLLVAAAGTALLAPGAGALTRSEPIPVPVIGQVDPSKPVCVVVYEVRSGGLRDRYVCVGAPLSRA